MRGISTSAKRGRPRHLMHMTSTMLDHVKLNTTFINNFASSFGFLFVVKGIVNAVTPQDREAMCSMVYINYST
jgi:hypothetical protein